MVGKFLLYENFVYKIQISILFTTTLTFMDLRVSSIDIVSEPVPGRRLAHHHKRRLFLSDNLLEGAPWCTSFYFWQFPIIYY